PRLGRHVERYRLAHLPEEEMEPRASAVETLDAGPGWQSRVEDPVAEADLEPARHEPVGNSRAVRRAARGEVERDESQTAGRDFLQARAVPGCAERASHLVEQGTHFRRERPGGPHLHARARA